MNIAVFGASYVYSATSRRALVFLSILAFLTVGGSSLRAQTWTTLMDEDFEGYFPPPGWTVVNNVTGGTWQSNVARGVPNYAAAGSGDAAVAHPGDTNSLFWDTELRTPNVDLSYGACEEMRVTYASMFQDYAGNGELWVDYSTDGGTLWSNLRNQTSDDPPGGTPAPGGTSELHTIDCVGASQVMLRFRYQSSNTSAWCWHLDDVFLEARIRESPFIDDATPNAGPTTGGTYVIISGSDFTVGSSVTFGGVPALVHSITSDTIWVTTPPHAAGWVDVTVENSWDASTLVDGFQYVECASGDADGDGVCNDVDWCEGDDATGDSDRDGVCDDLDACFGDDLFGDSDGDGVCDDVDHCWGDDASGDADHDGYCALAADGVTVVDCDDDNNTVYPGAPERCDGLDNACAGAVPDEEADLDGDGYSICDGDCDDGNAERYPGAPERCDGLDNDCDGVVDISEYDLDGDGVRGCEDCDDLDGDAYPGAPEVCDGVDNNCDGVVDEGTCDGTDNDDDLSGGGCGCRASSSGAPVPGLLFGLLLLAGWIRRRRRGA